MDDTLQKLKGLLDLVDTKQNAEDIAAAFEEAVTIFLQMKADNAEERQAIQQLFIKLSERVEDKLANIKNGKDGKDGRDGIDGRDGADGIGIDGKNGENGKDGSPDTPEQVRDKLEELKDGDRLDASAIKNLPEFVKETTRIAGGYHGLYALTDVDVAGITAGQSLKWDGTRWIAYTPAGGANTPVYEEAPTDSGDHINFTLAHTPAANTFRLYRGGARQQAGVDYTLTGAALVLSVILLTDEVILADYEY